MLRVAYLEYCSRLFPKHTWLSSSLLYHTAGTVSGKQGTWESHTLCLVFMQESWFLVFCHSFNTSDVLNSGFAHEVSGVNADISGESTVQRLHRLCKEHFQAGQGGLFQNTEALLTAEKQFGQRKAWDNEMIGATMRRRERQHKMSEVCSAGKDEELQNLKPVLAAEWKEEPERDRKTWCHFTSINTLPTK